MARFRDDPNAFTRFLEAILTPLMRQALSHGGVIDRFTADGFTAYWNAPLADPDHAVHACEAADGMIRALARIREEMEARRRMDEAPIPPVEIGIGIATGPAVTGGFGGHGRSNYTINGEVARLAMRLQALSRNYGPTVIVGEETREKGARDFALRHDGESSDAVFAESPRPGHLPRAYLSVAQGPAVGQGQGLDRAMPAALRRLPDAL
jgi:adenylate cyclase